MPHELSTENKAQRSTICKFLLNTQENEPFIYWIVTGNKKWFLYVNPMAFCWSNTSFDTKTRPTPEKKRAMHLVEHSWYSSLWAIETTSDHYSRPLLSTSGTFEPRLNWKTSSARQQKKCHSATWQYSKTDPAKNQRLRLGLPHPLYYSPEHLRITACSDLCSTY